MNNDLAKRTCPYLQHEREGGGWDFFVVSEMVPFFVCLLNSRSWKCEGNPHEEVDITERSRP